MRIAPEVHGQVAGRFAVENPPHVQRHAPSQPPGIGVRVDAGQQTPVDLAAARIREGGQAPRHQALHEALELGGRELGQRHHVHRVGCWWQRCERGVSLGADPHDIRCDAGFPQRGAEVRLQQRSAHEQRLADQVGQAAEGRHGLQAAYLVRSIPGDRDVGKVGHAADPLARRVGFTGEALRVGVENEGRHDGLRQAAAGNRVGRRDRAVRQHDVDIRIGEQRLHRFPGPGQCPVSDALRSGRKGHGETRGGQRHGFRLEPGPELRVGGPRSVEDRADDTWVAAHLGRGRRRGRGQQHESEWEGCPVSESLRAER